MIHTTPFGIFFKILSILIACSISSLNNSAWVKKQCRLPDDRGHFFVRPIKKAKYKNKEASSP